jgi:hypothetical protein
MEQINLSQVQLHFKFGAVHDTYMTVCVNGIDVLPDINQQAMIQVPVHFPSVLILKLSGKNNNIDTLIDNTGKITQDKFVQLTQVKIDRMSVSDHFLQKWPIVNNSFTTSYFGFNGQVQLTFDSPTSFHWLLRTKQQDA